MKIKYMDLVIFIFSFIIFGDWKPSKSLTFLIFYFLFHFLVELY
jgi:hypothetical protein